MVDLLNEALDYLNHGYVPVPTIRGARRTAVKWKEFQERRPTEEEVVSWFSGKDYNLQIVCGAISRCVVVDADSEEAIRYCFLHLPTTPFRVKTNKGMHFYFKHPGYHVQSCSKILKDPPVDIRADGGMAVGFGSTHHKTSHIYHLDAGADLVSAASLPAYQPIWFPIKELPPPIKRVAISGDSMTRAERYIRSIEQASKGQRNDCAFRVSAILTRDFGLEKEQAFTLLSQWNAGNQPPLSELELEQILVSSTTSGRNPLGYKL